MLDIIPNVKVIPPSDQLRAQAKYHGASLMLVNIPDGLIFQIDLQQYSLSYSEVQFIHIPPSLHCFKYSLPNQATSVFFFHVFIPNEVLILQWNTKLNVFEHCERLSPASSPTCPSIPYNLDYYISWSTFSCHIVSSLVDSLLSDHYNSDQLIHFPKLPSLSKMVSKFKGKEKTAKVLDQSWFLEELMEKYSRISLLSYFQISFILLYLCENYSGLYYYNRFIEIISNSESLFTQKKYEQFIEQFLGVFVHQLSIFSVDDVELIFNSITNTLNIGMVLEKIIENSKCNGELNKFRKQLKSISQSISSYCIDELPLVELEK
ncbi:hypothetical protein P9112_007770 [Eukaryota sp. TZLM1-RC]